MEKIRWGIIGCGDVTERKSGPAFYKLEDSALVAVMRRNGALAEDYARRHSALAEEYARRRAAVAEECRRTVAGDACNHAAPATRAAVTEDACSRIAPAAPAPGQGAIRWYDDADALIHDPEVDAVYVATPPGSHCAYTLAAFQAGKPVYVEKPMALDYTRCRSMIEYSRMKGIPLFVAYYRRSLPYFLKVKELLRGGAIGDPLKVRLAFACPPRPEDLDRENPPWRLQKEISGGGYLLDMGSHQINLLQWLFGGGEVVESTVANRGGLYELEDSVAATLRFDGGLKASCTWDFAAPPEKSADLIEVAGTKGTMRFSAFEMKAIDIAGAGKAGSGNRGTEAGYRSHGTENRGCEAGSRGGEDGATHFEIPAPEHIQMPNIGKINRILLQGGFDYKDTEEAALTTRLMDRILGKD